MIINKIEITNIKGIKHLVLNNNLQPNRPNILVAPNGFGKTSIAKAFALAQNGKLKLEKEDRFNEDESNQAKITIGYSTGDDVYANEDENTIKNIFNIYVVNSQLKPVAKAQHFNNRTFAKASLNIEPTVLIANIPHKIEFSYKFSEVKRTFGESGKILTNISPIFNNVFLLHHIEQKLNFHQFTLKKFKDSINSIILDLNSCYRLSANDIKKHFEDNEYEFDFPDYTQLCHLLNSVLNLDNPTEIFFLGWQYIHTRESMRGNFNKAIKYLQYINNKKSIDDTIARINPVADRFLIKSEEKRQHDTTSLIINWPKAHLISSGQRDCLVFIAKLIECEFQTKGNCIIVIDEIFDYLDDANLVAFQYYISTLINRYRQQKRIIFPILLTHLDPKFLNHFCFDDKRLNVCYLKETKARISNPMIKLITNREHPLVKDILDSYYFHYNPNISDKDFTTEFNNVKLNQDWSKPEKFHKKINRELRLLIIDDLQFDPLAVCFATRIKIEEIVYLQLRNDEERNSFITTHKTTEKLKYAQNIGIFIPETYFLLGIVYNHPLHNCAQEITQSLGMKLENPIIKNMINNLWD